MPASSASPTVRAPAPTSAKYPGHIPGEAGIWVLVLGDMTVFGLMFACFTWYRAQSLELYLQSQATLDQTLGMANTLLLLTSSWFVALAMAAIRAARRVQAARLLALAFACGAGFIGLKVIEYGAKIGAGITLTTNEFYTFYFVLTGLHMLHVLVGMGVLALLWRRARAAAATADEGLWMEGGATFWHMVDLLWIVIFPLLYLLQ
ncbi:cytochrome c oxidase subunit 3 [Panacagrimonas sp.]|uniref:cytochrome c oxidase subunit 3 n=1 Tax=Panacagrimonas sp. TaxID=2480088 RepID=UPI003B52E846